MADTAHKTKEELTEYFDTHEELAKKAKQIAGWIKNSKHCVFFTGAGISTSAGISDFRGPTGVWTRRAEGKKPISGTNTISAFPTLCHMSLVELQRQGLVKYLVSQNTDGLHRRSGFPTSAFSELHGNSNIEKCKKCKKEYVRDGRVRTAGTTHEHETGRLCDNVKCGGKLHDTIINFGENLPSKPLRLAQENSAKADVYIVLGSSLRVSPANDMPETAADNGAHLVICNLQKTPLDAKSDCRVFARCDELMLLIMQEFNVEIPSFVLRRRVLIRQVGTGKSSKHVTLEGMDSDGTPFEFFEKVDLNTSPATKTPVCLRKPPFTFKDVTAAVSVTIHFRGHYNEPALTIPLPKTTPDLKKEEKALLLEFDPVHTKQWTVSDWDTEYQQIFNLGPSTSTPTTTTTQTALQSAIGKITGALAGLTTRG